VLEPAVLPASTVIDWTLPPGQRIGERVDAKGRPDPLAEATLARIEAGLARHARLLLVPAGGTWRQVAKPVDEPLPTRTTGETDGLVVPPLVVPVAKRAGVDTASVELPLRTQTCRRETAVVIPPFVSLLRGGGSKTTAYPVAGPLPTVSAQGNHHGLVGPTADTAAMRLAYYSNGPARAVAEPVGTLTTRDRYALVGGGTPVEQRTFRMLATHEIAAGMGFAKDYRVKSSKRDQVRGYGNAVTPPAAEVPMSALVEAIGGEAVNPTV
jgi:DNA (cytosine-5)-methyltransferase 1